MAFPYYAPTYQYPAYQPTYQTQPVYQAQPQQVYSQSNPQNGIIWISGEQEAQMYPVAPNNAVTLWNQTEPVVYLKQADATGKPTLKTYDLVERVQTVPVASDGKDGKSIEYATKSDLTAVVGVVKGFDDLIGTLKSDIETMKSDMYGIAGKKKSSKKAERVVDEEEDE